jgi:hypothetical protein
MLKTKKKRSRRRKSKKRGETEEMKEGEKHKVDIKRKNEKMKGIFIRKEDEKWTKNSA